MTEEEFKKHIDKTRRFELKHDKSIDKLVYKTGRLLKKENLKRIKSQITELDILSQQDLDWKEKGCRYKSYKGEI